MTTGDLRTRRVFLADLGRGSIALAVLSIAGCGSAVSSAVSGSARPSSAPASQPSGSATAAPSATDPASPTASGSGGAAGPGFAWTRVSLGFVSAYILVRAGEAVIVDTGNPGSDGEIESALGGIGLAWADVGHVVLTHKHGDHAGSAEAVLTAATGATGYAGAEDLPNITSPRPLTAVADGATVAGLRIVSTPGHTAGHIAVLDELGGILVAGDALGTATGTLTGSNPQFTEDATAAAATLVKLGGLQFETLLVGHGDPILTGASAQVAALKP